MKPRLKSRIIQPNPTGMFYIEDPLTKYPLTGTMFDNLYMRAVAYRKANSIPIGLDFEQEIEDEVCRRYPNECEVNRRTLGIPSIAPGLYDVVRGSMAMVNHKIDGGQLVSQEEANRRAEICYRCPLRSQMTLPCSRCVSALENVVGWITQHRSTPFDEKLSACGICKCFLSASVWLPLSTQCIAVTDDMVEKFKFAADNFQCWKVCT